jgi:hypothetical protein
MPAGVPGVYSVSRVVDPNEIPDVTSEWITPPLAEEVQGFSTSRRAANGTDSGGFNNDQARWSTSIQAAFDGYELIPQVSFGEVWYEQGEPSEGQVQQSRMVASVAFPPVSDPLPPGATGVEYENPAGTPVGDVTIDGAYTTNITNSLGELDNQGVRFYLAPVDEAWYTRAEVAALTSLGSYSGGVYNEADSVSYPVSFTASTSDADVAVLVQGGAIQNGIVTTVGVGGGRWSISSLGATRNYQPPRYRYIY